MYTHTCARTYVRTYVHMYAHNKIQNITYCYITLYNIDAQMILFWCHMLVMSYLFIIIFLYKLVKVNSSILHSLALCRLFFLQRGLLPKLSYKFHLRRIFDSHYCHENQNMYSLFLIYFTGSFVRLCKKKNETRPQYNRE